MKSYFFIFVKFFILGQLRTLSIIIAFVGFNSIIGCNPRESKSNSVAQSSMDLAKLDPADLSLKDPSALPSRAPIEVVVSFSILKNLVETVGGNEVSVTSLVGYNGDAHVFSATAQNLKKITTAELLFINGFGYEPWVDALTTSVKFRGKQIVVSKNVKPLFVRNGNGKIVSNEADPHAWQDPLNALFYVDEILNALVTSRPEKTSFFQDRARKLQKEIRELHTEHLKKYSLLKNKKVMTTHDAFQYYGIAYGIEFLSPYGWNTDGEISAHTLAKLISRMKSEKVKCLFLENTANPKILQQIQKEVHGNVGGVLLADALSLTVSTYIEMMKANFNVIFNCLDTKTSN